MHEELPPHGCYFFFWLTENTAKSTPPAPISTVRTMTIHQIRSMAPPCPVTAWARAHQLRDPLHKEQPTLAAGPRTGGVARAFDAVPAVYGELTRAGPPQARLIGRVLHVSRIEERTGRATRAEITVAEDGTLLGLAYTETDAD